MWLCLVTWLLALVASVRSVDLSFALITSYGEYGLNSSGVIPAVDMALEDISNDSSILQGYRLTYDQARDSGCLYAQSLEAFFKEIQSNPVKLAVIGCGCSVATQPVAAISSYWNISQISYVSVSPALSDRTTYKSYFRTSPSDDLNYPAFYSILKHFKWMRIGLLTQKEDLFTIAELNIRKVLESYSYTVESRIFETMSDPVTSVYDVFMQADKYRVFFLNCYSGPARKIICQAAKMGYTYPEYAWIANDWYNDEWWTAAESDEFVNCTDGELQQFVEHFIYLNSLPTAQDNIGGITAKGLTPPQMFVTEYNQRCTQRGYEVSEAAGRAYDAVWVLALALNNTMAMYNSNGHINGTGCEDVSGSLVPLERFNYSNAKMGCLIQWNIQRTNIYGVTGQIRFDANGTRIQDTIQLKKYTSTLSESGALIRVPFALFNIQNNYTWNFLPNYSDSTIYPDGIPPDGTPINITQTYSIPMIIIIDVLSTCGIILVLFCLMFNLLYRKKKVVRLSSVNLNYAILLGALLMYLSVYFYLVPTTNTSILLIICVVKEWLFIIGYSLCFGTVLSKMWRIYKIFQNPTPNKKVLKDYHLLFITSSIVSIGIGLLVLGAAIPQLLGSVTLQIDNENPSGTAAAGVEIKYSLLVCYTASSPSFYWKILIFVYLAVLQMIGIMLAFQTRKVKYTGLRDSKFVAAIIYVSSLILVVLAVDTFILNTYLNTYGAIFSLGILILTTAFLLLTFVPKMVMLHEDSNLSSTQVASSPVTGDLREPADQTKPESRDLSETLQEKERVIAALQKEIRALKEQDSSCKAGEESQL